MAMFETLQDIYLGNELLDILFLPTSESCASEYSLSRILFEADKAEDSVN
jgi:hypothetical protein